MISSMAMDEEHGEVSSDAEQRGRLTTRRMRILFIVVPAVLVGIGIGLGAAGLDLPVSGSEPPEWQGNLGLAISAVGALLVVFGLVRMIRSGTFKARRRVQAWPTSSQQRRQVARQIRRAEPVSDDALAVARTIAQEMVRQHKAAPLYVGMLLNMVGTSLWLSVFWLVALMLLTAALLVVAVVMAYRDANLAQRWLHAYPQPVTSEAASS